MSLLMLSFEPFPLSLQEARSLSASIEAKEEQVGSEKGMYMHEQSTYHNSLKNRLRCYANLPTVQEAFQPIHDFHL